jgi:hypothetical protein
VRAPSTGAAANLSDVNFEMADSKWEWIGRDVWKDLKAPIEDPESQIPITNLDHLTPGPGRFPA